MTRLCAEFATLAVLVLAAQANASAQNAACKPVNGMLVSQMVVSGELMPDGSLCAAAPGLFCTTGRFAGGLAGAFVFTATAFNPFANPDFALTGAGFFTGDLILQTNRGGLVFKDAGAVAVDGDVLTFASVLTITNGTGGLAGATGRIRDEGIFMGGCVDCRYRGDVCLAAGGANGTGAGRR